jgi:glycosyltransferase involved in cell wall biosynthesis
MKCNVPVIAKIPNLPPSWMNEGNGIWITDQTLLSDVIADFIQNWLEDNIKPEIYDEMKKTSEQFSDKQKFESTLVSLFEGYFSTRAEAFEQQITKTEE